MKKLISVVFLCLIAPAFAGKEPTEFDTWLKTFYKTDDIAKFDKHWTYVVKQKVLEDDKAVDPIIGFFSQVIHRHPELIAGRFDDLGRFSKTAKKAVVAILWHSDTEAGRKVLGAGADTERADVRPPKIGEHQILQASDLDFCWGYFFATGDTHALDPIIETLDFSKFIGSIDGFKKSKQTEADKADVLKEAMFQATMWSLSANGRELPEVLTHLEATFAAKTAPDDRRLWLAIVLSKLKPEKYKVDLSSGQGARIVVTPDVQTGPVESSPAWRDREGNAVQQTDECKSVEGFGAHVVPTSDPDWEAKWNTPADHTPSFTKTGSIVVGTKMAFLVFFSNPKPDKNGEVEVVYDVTIRRPDGKSQNLSGLKGAKGKFQGQPTLTYLVDAPIGFAGAADDPLGVWIFEFAVRDVVRGVTVPLKATIILTAAEKKPSRAKP